MLQVAGMAAEHWLLTDGSSGAQHLGDGGGLPAYLHAAQPIGGRQPFFQGQQRQEQQHRRQGSDDHYQHWPAPAAGEGAAAESHDAIQEADEGAHCCSFI